MPNKLLDTCQGCYGLMRKNSG